MYKFLLLTLALCLASSLISAQILSPFEFEDELLYERIGYNPAPTGILPSGALFDSIQYGEFNGFDWEDDEVIRVTRTADLEIFSQSWSNQFGDYAYDTARFLISGAADSFWIERSDSYFDFGSNQRDTFTSKTLGKRWYQNGLLDSVRMESTYVGSISGSDQDEVSHSFTYGPHGLTSFSAFYTSQSYRFEERIDVSYTSNGEKSGYQVFEIDGNDIQLDLSAVITRPASNQIQYTFDDFGERYVVDQYLSAEGYADSIRYTYSDGSETFMATLARIDDGTDPRYVAYAFISGDIDDPERLRFWLSEPLSEVDQLPLVAGKLIASNPTATGALVQLNDLIPGTRISIVDTQGRILNTNICSSSEVSFDWPELTNGLYFIVAQLPGHATRAWELIGM